MRTAVIVLSALAGVGFAGIATSQATVLSFNFQNLSGRYLSASGQFSANAANAPDAVASFGGVAPNALNSGATNFGTPATGGNPATGFIGLGSSNFQLSLSASGFTGAPNTGGLRANGFGTFTITDNNGDRLTGNIVGDVVSGAGWNQIFSTLIYSGFLQDVVFIPRIGATDSIWEGPNGGSFDWTQLPATTFNGSIVTLNFVPGSTFGAAFNAIGDWGYDGSNAASAVPVGVNAQLLPTPGAAALLGLGAMVTRRRRR